jgi:hypothetical protein
MVLFNWIFVFWLSAQSFVWADEVGCSGAKASRAQHLYESERAFWFQKSIQEASVSPWNLEEEDRWKGIALRADQIPGSTLDRRNREWVYLYVEALQRQGFEWIETPLKMGKIKWIPLRKWLSHGSIQEWMKVCGTDGLNRGILYSKKKSERALCSGWALYFSAHRFGPDVRPKDSLLPGIGPYPLIRKGKWNAMALKSLIKNRPSIFPEIWCNYEATPKD